MRADFRRRQPVGFRKFSQTGRGASFECVVLRQPFFPPPVQFAQFIAQFQNDNFQLVFVVCGMAKMILSLESGKVVLLERSPFSLVAGWIGMAVVARQVELVDWLIEPEVLADDNDPSLLVVLARIEKLQLGVGDAAVCGIDVGGFGAVALANDLDEAFAGVELLT